MNNQLKQNLKHPNKEYSDVLEMKKEFQQKLDDVCEEYNKKLEALAE